MTKDIDPHYPVKGLVFEHHSGKRYRVLSVANLVSTKPGWPPPFVAYEDIETGVEYARPLSAWLVSKYTLVQ